MALTKTKKTERRSSRESSRPRPRPSSAHSRADRVEGLRAAQDGSRRRRQLPRREEQAGCAVGEGTKIEAALQGLKGVSSVAYTSGDPVALAKALSTWVKDNAEFTFKLGIVDGKVIDVGRDWRTGDDAGQGRALLEAALPDQFSGAASGDGHQRDRPRSGCGHQPGRSRRRSLPVGSAPAAPAAETAAPAAEASHAEVEAAHVEESAAGEQPSGAAQPENATASQAGEAAGRSRSRKAHKFRLVLSGAWRWSGRNGNPEGHEATEAQKASGEAIGSSKVQNRI